MKTGVFTDLIGNKSMKIIITIGNIKVELTDTTDNAIKYQFDDIKKLITSVVEDYKKLDL
jgi:cellobiose-specific phosphotransferase system component IIA